MHGLRSKGADGSTDEGYYATMAMEGGGREEASDEDVMEVVAQAVEEADEAEAVRQSAEG